MSLLFCILGIQEMKEPYNLITRVFLHPGHLSMSNRAGVAPGDRKIHNEHKLTLS